MSGSNRPQVLGLVIITPATSGPSRALSAARSTRPSAVAGNILDPEAGEGRGRGVGAVGAFGHQHHAARVAARLERRADAQQAAQFAMRARLGRHRDAVHAGERDQPVGEFVDHLIAPCTVSCGWSGWMSAKPGIRATFSLSRGLCFIVQLPSGNRPRSIA